MAASTSRARSRWRWGMALAVVALMAVPTLGSLGDLGHPLGGGPAALRDFGGAPRAPLGESAHDGAGGSQRIASLPALPSALVNPLTSWSHEPAPMGIADFGVSGTGRGAQGYSYTSSAVEGSAAIRSMNVTITSSSPVVAFELNAVLVLQWGGTNYTYWIQNGLHVDTSTHEFTIGGAYVWNFSSSGAKIAVGEVDLNNSSTSGGGQLIYFIPGKCGVYAGQCSTLSYPAVLTGRLNVSTDAGVPRLTYSYDLGAGWVTYDWARFPHLTGARVIGFVVNGFQHTPVSAYYDTEWVWVGAGGGTSSHDVDSNLTMALEYWNGQNYQAVPSAWNFGANTGESAGNVIESSTSGAGGVPGARLAAGSGTLGILYNGSSVGSLNVSVPGPIVGTLDVGGVGYPLNGSGENLTLASGTYAVALPNYANASVSVDVVGGRTAFVNLSGAGRTAFRAAGLPLGTLWGMTVGGVHRSTTGTVLVFSLANGTYGIAYDAVPGYVRNVSAPTVLAVVAPGTISIDWSPFTFTASVTETGLPSATVWWVTAANRTVTGAGLEILLNLPNGSTSFSVGSAYEFVATPASGWINITAGSVSPTSIQFGYRPTFVAGAVTPVNATVTLDGRPLLVGPDGSFNISVTPGSYTLNASAPGFVPWSELVLATPGNVTHESIALQTTSPGGHSPHGGNGTSGGTITSTSGSATLEWVAVGAVAIVAGLVVAVVALRRRAT